MRHTFCFFVCALSMGLGAPPARAQIQFISDLEDADAACFASRPAAGCGGWLGIHDAPISVSRGEAAHSGSKALRIEFTKNENYGGAFRAVSGRHLFTRFYDYYDSGFDFAAGMKIHRLSGFNDAKQVNDFDIILQSKADETGSNYCGLTDSKYLALSCNGGPVDWGSVEGRFTFQRRRWYCIETEVKLNTPGASDGEVRIWVDGRLFAEKTGMNLVGNVGSPINRAMFGGWYSNSAAGKNPCPDPVGPSLRYVDDAAVSGSYIGPIPDVAYGSAPVSRVITVTLPFPGSLRVEYGTSAAYGASTPLTPSANGYYAFVIPGLDSNATYHYRLTGKWNSGGAYLSPDQWFSTAPGGGVSPSVHRPKHHPVNLKAHDYDPIP